MQRTPEPELMDDPAQALAYASADFSEPNHLVLEQLRERFPGLPEHGAGVDLGCGPADISVRLLQERPSWSVDAVDGAAAMLEHAARLARDGGVQDRLRLHRARLPLVRLPPLAYDLVLSNSLLHHLPHPAALWETVARLGAPGAAVLVMDLRRPDSPVQAQALVDRYAANEPEVLRRDFLASLHAAFTPDEVAAQLRAAGLNLNLVLPTDRHLVVWGELP